MSGCDREQGTHFMCDCMRKRMRRLERENAELWERGDTRIGAIVRALTLAGWSCVNRGNYTCVMRLPERWFPWPRRERRLFFDTYDGPLCVEEAINYGKRVDLPPSEKYNEGSEE